MTTRQWTILALLLYAVMAVTIVLGLARARAWSHRELATVKGQADWETFRTDMAQQAEQPGPVKRRVPKSTQPPALVLLRDHFAMCVTISLVLSSVLFVFTILFIRGSLS